MILKCYVLALKSGGMQVVGICLVVESARESFSTKGAILSSFLFSLKFTDLHIALSVKENHNNQSFSFVEMHNQ